MERVIIEERSSGCLGNQLGCSGGFLKPSYRRFLVENRKLEMPPKEMRNLSDLLQGIRNNNLKEVKTIIERRFSKKDRGNQLLLAGELGERYAKEIEAAILEASRLTDPSILKYLIKNGAQINFVADAPVPVVSSKVSPLHLAVESGLPDTVSFLLESNADVNRLDHNGRSTLHLAVERTDCECTRMILCRGADVHRLDKDGKTALQVASKFGHVELVRILLEHSAQVFHEGQRGPSPLHIAAIEGHVPLIDIFSRYVDVNIRVPCCENGKEKTALHLAAERGLVETVRFLLERFGADVNVLDSDDQNALHCAMMHKHDHRRMRRKEDYDAMVDLFLKKHVNIKQQNADGNTPLHLAAQNQFHRVVEMLLLAQADPLGKNNIEQIPLDMIPEFDVPMRQLFNKYAVITSPYITNSALQQPVAPEPIQTQKKVEFAPPHVLEPIAEVETIKPTSTKSKKSAPIPPKHSALKQGEPRMSSQQTAHFAPKSTKGASIYTAKVSTQHGTKVQVSQAPVPISLRKVDSAESEPKVFHVHVKSIPSLAATENGHLEGPHCSVIHTNDFKKTPSAPTLVR